MDDRHGFFAVALADVVGQVRLEHHELHKQLAVAAAVAAGGPGPTCGCEAALFTKRSSGTSSSSISVVSVPLDVTGDGPTMSLVGLMRWLECALRNDCGRREWESAELLEDLSGWRVSKAAEGGKGGGGDRWGQDKDRRAGPYMVVRCELIAGETGGGDIDISGCGEKGGIALALDDRNGASRAMAVWGAGRRREGRRF